MTCRPWPKRSLSLTLSLGPDLTSLEGDRRLVSMILVNLIGNAIKFTDRGAVELSVGCGGGQHRMVVKDSGPGIPLDRQHLVFEPFEQLEPVRDKHTPGVGLGLSLVRGMLDAIGGRVELSSTVGVGSTFTVAAAVDRDRAPRERPVEDCGVSLAGTTP